MRENISGDYIGRCLCPVSAASYTGLTPTEQALVRALIKAGGLAGSPTRVERPPWSRHATERNSPFAGTYPQLQEAPAAEAEP